MQDISWRLGLVAGALAVLAGCILAPVSRTWYEPDPRDGTPSPSASCGYHRAAADSLLRQLGGVELTVSPGRVDQRPFRISVLLGRPTRTVDLDPTRLEVRFDGSAGVAPAKVEATSQESSAYYSEVVRYTFPSAPDTEEIAVVFLPGFIRLGGEAVDVAPFRFRKNTKWDIYYGSINC